MIAGSVGPQEAESAVASTCLGRISQCCTRRSLSPRESSVLKHFGARMPIKVSYALPRGAQRDPEFEIPIWQAFVGPPADRGPADPYLHERIAQTGTPPPIRIAGAGFRGPGNMRKSPCPAYRTQIRRPEFLARCFQDRLPIAASRFCYVNASRESRLRDCSWIANSRHSRQPYEGVLLASQINQDPSRRVRWGLIDRQ